MIARFAVLLPFDLTIKEGDELPALEFVASGYEVRFHAPTLSVVRPGSAASIFASPLSFGTATAAPFSDAIMVGGKRTAQVNLLVIDFKKPEFNRPSAPSAQRDPDLSFAFDVANQVLSRLRVYSRAFQIKPLQNGDAWQLMYMTDGEQQLVAEEGKIRRLSGGHAGFNYAAITPEAIDLVAARSGRTDEPHAWDQLLLDAFAQLPDIGSAVVMAFAALETFIAWALEILHHDKPLPQGLWEWINERGDDFRKQPSVSEEFDVLLRVFTGHSLKEKAQLWTAFSELRHARNKLVHEGVAQLKSGQLTADKAKELVTNAEEIIKWIETLLPGEHRRPVTDAAGPFLRRLATDEESRYLPGAGTNRAQAKPAGERPAHKKCRGGSRLLSFAAGLATLAAGILIHRSRSAGSR